MSTGLCLGANMADVNLVKRWVVDLNQYAFESLKLNHPETETFNVVEGDDFQENQDAENVKEDDEANDGDTGDAAPDDEEVFEVGKIIGI
ncbi:hypothetical protein Tco_0355439 [Tanacetum coccineum]